jgi:hypothetical protein
MSSPNPVSPRPILRLKIGARKPLRESKTATLAEPSSAGKSKPGAQWSDEYKRRMQVEMDALSSR